MLNTNLEKEKIKINTILANNLSKLIRFKDVSISDLCETIEEKEQISLHRSTFSKYINHPSEKSIPLPFLLSCCKYFQVTFEDLVREDFEPSEEDLKRRDEDSETITFPRVHPPSEVFVENPKSPILEKYLQTYYCYYFSTVSSENKVENAAEAILAGTLKLEPDGCKSKATLKIDTKTQDERGNPNYKIYTGNVVVCPSIQSIHCILSNKEGEFCFLIFRYSHLFFYKQECRMAEVLSTSSTLDKRYPTTHRMLLSQKKIKDKDLCLIAPHLKLNYSQITVSQEALLQLSEISDEYTAIVEELMEKGGQLMFSLKEKDVIQMAEKYLKKEEIIRFLTELRERSLAYRYNKVSQTADTMVRDVLRGAGYFKKANTGGGPCEGSSTPGIMTDYP